MLASMVTGMSVEEVENSTFAHFFREKRNCGKLLPLWQK
jgi:hypothetical protein